MSEQPADKAREARTRRRAQRHGMALVRNKARSADAPAFGKYQLTRTTERTGIVRPVTGWVDLPGIDRELDELAAQR